MHIEYSARAHTIFIGRDEIEDHGLLSDRFKFELNEFLVLADRKPACVSFLPRNDDV